MSAIDAIGENIIDIDPIELRSGHVRLAAPGPSAIHADDGSAIIRQDHVARVVRIDPEIMVITMLGIHRLPGLATIGGFQHWGAEYINHLIVLWVREQFDIIPGPLDQAMVVGDLVPMGTGII